MCFDPTDFKTCPNCRADIYPSQERCEECKFNLPQPDPDRDWDDRINNN